MGMLANGYSKQQLEDLESECETLISSLAEQSKLLRSSFVLRGLYDIALRFIQNNRRTFVQLNAFRIKNKSEYELFIKMRFEFVH